MGRVVRSIAKVLAWLVVFIIHWRLAPRILLHLALTALAPLVKRRARHMHPLPHIFARHPLHLQEQLPDFKGHGHARTRVLQCTTHKHARDHRADRGLIRLHGQQRCIRICREVPVGRRAWHIHGSAPRRRSSIRVRCRRDERQVFPRPLVWPQDLTRSGIHLKGKNEARRWHTVTCCGGVLVGYVASTMACPRRMAWAEHTAEGMDSV